MRALKLIGLFIGTLLTTELAGYFLFGRERINEVIIDNHQTALPDFPDSLSERKSLFTNQRLTDKEKNDWKLLFKDDQVEFNHYDGSQFNNVRPTMNHFNYVIHTAHEFIILEIEESENSFEYVGSWHSLYIWLFVDWVKIEKKSTGQS